MPSHFGNVTHPWAFHIIKDKVKHILLTMLKTPKVLIPIMKGKDLMGLFIGIRSIPFLWSRCKNPKRDIHTDIMCPPYALRKFQCVLHNVDQFVIKSKMN